jgi:hypothetical protein
MQTANTATVTITAEGEVRFLVNTASQVFIQPESIVRRASHVEPDGRTARVVFHSLRLIFGETGAVSEFTRSWPVLWRVNLAPTGGPILSGRWMDRQAAIAAEVEYLNENFI